MTKKIGHPLNKEYAIGAATLTDYFIRPVIEISKDYLEKELKSIRSKLKHMYDIFLGRKQPRQLTDKTVIVIDDGMASGSTLLGTIQIIKKSMPKKIIVVVPKTRI